MLVQTSQAGKMGGDARNPPLRLSDRHVVENGYLLHDDMPGGVGSLSLVYRMLLFAVNRSIREMT
jgi:hypothetical protein